MKRSNTNTIEPNKKYQKTTDKELVTKLVQDIDNQELISDILTLIHSKHKLSEINNSNRKNKNLFSWACHNGKIDLVKELINDENTKLIIKGNAHSNGLINAFTYLCKYDSDKYVAAEIINMILDRKDVDLSSSYIRIFTIMSYSFKSQNIIRLMYKRLINHRKFPKKFNDKLIHNRNMRFNRFFLLDLILQKNLRKKNNREYINNIFKMIIYERDSKLYKHYIQYKKKYKKLLFNEPEYKQIYVADEYYRYCLLYQLELIKENDINIINVKSFKNRWLDELKTL